MSWSAAGCDGRTAGRDGGKSAGGIGEEEATLHVMSLGMRILLWPDGRTRPLLVDGYPIMPSGVYADADAQLPVGRDALRLAQADPIWYEPNPERRINDPVVPWVTASTPRRICSPRACRRGGRGGRGHRLPAPPAVLTYVSHGESWCPATWDAERRRMFADTLVRAGWPPLAEHTLSGPTSAANPVVA